MGNHHGFVLLVDISTSPGCLAKNKKPALANSFRRISMFLRQFPNHGFVLWHLNYNVK